MAWVAAQVAHLLFAVLRHAVVALMILPSLLLRRASRAARGKAVPQDWTQATFYTGVVKHSRVAPHKHAFQCAHVISQAHVCAGLHMHGSVMHSHVVQVQCARSPGGLADAPQMVCIAEQAPSGCFTSTSFGRDHRRAQPVQMHSVTSGGSVNAGILTACSLL